MNKNKFFTQFVIALTLFFHLSTVWAQTSQNQTLCAPAGYTVGFFNGVWNTRTEALGSMNVLKSVIGSSHKDENIKYDLFYNETGSEVDATWWQDIAEVFIQRAQEFDNSGELGKRFEYLWEVSSDSNRSFFNRLADMANAASLALDGMYSDFMTKVVAGLSVLSSKPPTEENYAEHRTRLDALAIEGQKLLLIAHSQGNLFVNETYDHVTKKTDVSSVGVVHIAPASIVLHGEHVLADIDIVINGLRLEGIASVPPINLYMPLSISDPYGHTLVGTYLDGTRPGRDRVWMLTYEALEKLKPPTSFKPASTGFFTVTMTWNGLGDVDLHTTEPDGTQVFYQHLEGQSGYLDVDNTYGHGPEHYYASCNPAQLQAGVYRIGINNYANATGRTATVQTSFAQGGQPLTKKLGVGPERGPGGNINPIPVMTVTVTQDANGKFSAMAE